MGSLRVARSIRGDCKPSHTAIQEKNRIKLRSLLIEAGFEVVEARRFRIGWVRVVGRE
jgi:hypothetical protein